VSRASHTRPRDRLRRAPAVVILRPLGAPAAPRNADRGSGSSPPRSPRAAPARTSTKRSVRYLGRILLEVGPGSSHPASRAVAARGILAAGQLLAILEPRPAAVSSRSHPTTSMRPTRLRQQGPRVPRANGHSAVKEQGEDKPAKPLSQLFTGRCLRGSDRASRGFAIRSAM